MWILFGVNYNTVENEPQVYFIGVFDTMSKCEEERLKLIDFHKANTLVSGVTTKYTTNDFFIKECTINTVYNLEWSNSDDTI